MYQTLTLILLLLKENGNHAQLNIIFALYYGCGLRRTEGMKLKISDINFDNKTLFVHQGKKLTFHILRHTIATHLLQNNVSIENIAQFLGHSSLESAQIYTHIINR